MLEKFTVETVVSASKLRYAGRGRGNGSPVHPKFEHLCALVETRGRRDTQKLIKRIERICSLIADSLPAQEYDEYFGFVGLRNGLILAFADMSPTEIQKFGWDVRSVLHELFFTRQACEETLDNRWAPEPWTVYVSSLGRSRASVRPWRSKPSRDKDLLDTWQFLDHEVIVAERVATRESGEHSGKTSIRVTKFTDFGKTREVLLFKECSLWSSGHGESDCFISIPLDANAQAWLDWIDHKSEQMPSM
jgi:hypothetical protein